MRRLPVIAPLALFALVLATPVLLPAPAAALDCTPFLNWTCGSPGYFNTLNGQPGEILCGVDYTGWTLHVIRVTAPQAGVYVLGGASASASMVFVDTAIMLMSDCSAGTCLASVQNSGVAQLNACLDVGVHTFVVASHTTAPGAFMNVSLSCLTCAQAETAGIACSYCNAVADEATSWGSLKARFE